MIGCGVPAGANSAFQDSIGSSSRPSSTSVGISGVWGLRLAVVIASGRTALAGELAHGVRHVGEGHCTSPVTTAPVASAPPR